jgi:cobalt/nickel transport system permease protein
MRVFAGKKHNFIERSAAGALSFFKESVLSDEYAARRGLLQALDPRIKIASFIGLIAAVMFIRDSRNVFALYLLCVALAAASRIGILFFLKRTWVFIPLFSLFVAIPSLFSSFTPGEPMAVLSLWGGRLVITQQGFAGAVLFVSRVLVSVSLAVLMTITTRSDELFAALRCLGVPQIFVMTLSMCYRYIFLFAEIIQNMFMGIKSRTGGVIHYRKGQKIVAWNIAVLWQKSVQMNQDVYHAMLSRGYRGEARTLHRFRLRMLDWGWMGFSLVVSAALVMIKL